MVSKKIKLDRTLYHYLEWENPGRPKLLLLHGLKVECHCWTDMVDFLKNDFHIYAIDLKGHGESQKGEAHFPDYTLKQLNEEMKEFHDKVIKSPFTIAGYSLGGQYAISYASCYPETLKGIVMIDSAPQVSLKGIFFLTVLGLAKNKAYATKEELQIAYAKKGLPHIGKYMADYTLKQRPDGKYDYKFDDKNIAPATMKGNLARTKDLWNSLSKIKVKTLLLKGAKSQIISNGIVKRMKGKLPSLKVDVIPKVGHDILFTAPGLVAEKIKDQTINN